MTLFTAVIKLKIWLLTLAKIELSPQLLELYEGEQADVKLAQTFLHEISPKGFFEHFQLSIEFSGGGDSGDVHSDYLELTGIDIKEAKQKYPFLEKAQSSFISLHSNHSPLGKCPVNILHADNLVTDYADSYDWCNNDGGHGVIYINLDTLDTRTEYNLATTEYTEYEETSNLINDIS